MKPLTDVRDISRIAYGFMASKALFAALNLDVFTRLAGGPKPLETLASETDVTANRLRTLLTACVSLDLLEEEGGHYRNSPASQAYLVRTAPMYFGDYYRFQIDRQVYPAFQHLDRALRGDRIDFYGLMADAAEAESFSRAQHSGSLGPAHVLTKLVSLSECRRLLDVGGGTGAFTISLCRRYPALSGTIIDFPSVRPMAERLAKEAGLADRVTFHEGNALTSQWPDGQDVVLMSYLLSAVAEENGRRLIASARRVLKPGGLLVLHDFMTENDRRSPTSAALWLLAAVLMDPDAPALTPGWLAQIVTESGFTDISVADVIPTITKVLVARRI
jgi:2-hydroxy-4-(methylsulfanyl)butanoate S-methyltransferase